MLDKVTPTDEQLDNLGDKLLNRSKADNGCVIWLGAINDNGYGVARWLGRSHLVHRLGWQIHTRIKPKDNVLHRCDNPRCWFIEHLFEGTQQANITDMHNKGRAFKARGEHASKAVLTEIQVREIKVLLENKFYDNKHIGLMYGVCGESIRLIKTGRNWAHVR